MIRNGALKILSLINLFIMASLLLIVVWQVLSRYILNDPSTVSEELARILLMWLGPLGAAYVCAFRQHLSIDLLSLSLKDNAKLNLQRVITILSAFFSLILITGGSGIVKNAFVLEQKTAVLELSMGLVYLAIPISGVFMLIFFFFDFIEDRYDQVEL